MAKCMGILMLISGNNGNMMLIVQIDNYGNIMLFYNKKHACPDPVWARAGPR